MTAQKASSVFRIGNGAGFSGDRVDAPIPVVKTLIESGAAAGPGGEPNAGGFRL